MALPAVVAAAVLWLSTAGQVVQGVNQIIGGAETIEAAFCRQVEASAKAGTASLASGTVPAAAAVQGAQTITGLRAFCDNILNPANTPPTGAAKVKAMADHWNQLARYHETMRLDPGHPLMLGKPKAEAPASAVAPWAGGYYARSGR